MMKSQRAGAGFPLSHLLFPWLAAAVLLQSGCAQLGPEAMRASRLNYNEAVQMSDQRELLLNLVRLRYTEAPEFLQISGISTQMNFEVGASIGGEFGEVEENNSAFVAPGAAVGYSESPTITFIPRRDQEFTRQLVAPVELDSIYLLTSYGWGFDRVLILIADEINEVSNMATRESANLPKTDQQSFQKVIMLLRQLVAEGLVRVDVQRRSKVLSAQIPHDSVSLEDLLKASGEGYQLTQNEDETGYVLTKENNHYVMSVGMAAWERPELMTVSRALNIKPNQPFYEIDGKGKSQVNGLSITTRSVLGAMAYLSNAVAVPEDHAELVEATMAADPALQKYLNIRVSKTLGEGMYLAVRYRDYWFYLQDSDLESKRTLGLLTSLIRLTISAGGAHNVPVLTLPVSR